MPVRCRISTQLLIAAAMVFGFQSALPQNETLNLAFKYVGQGADIKRLTGNVEKSIADGDRLILYGDLDLPSSTQYQGPDWIARIHSDGQLLWSARAKEHPDRASLFSLATNGDSIWHGGLLKDGRFQLAKFEAKTLRKEASVQLALEATKTSAPYIQMHRETRPNFDLQISVVQAVGDSIRVALFSRDLRILFDKLYTFPKNSRALAGPYLARIPDHSGYYLFLRHPLPSSPKSSGGIAIVRLNNSGSIKWANTYAAGFPDLEVEPHETSDGCVLITVPQQTAKSIGSVFIKIGADGNVNWAVRTEGVTLSRGDFTFGWVPYPFVEPYLFAIGYRVSSARQACVLFALDYLTGKIEKQVACNFSGGIGFFEKTNDSLYVTLLDQIMSGRFKSQAALLRFDFDLNLRAAKSIRNAEPRWPILRELSPGKLLFSYSYADQKTVVVETIDENFESGNACGVLQKANYSVTKSNFVARAVDIARSPLTSIIVSDANSKISEADLSLVPLDLKAIACHNQP